MRTGDLITVEGKAGRVTARVLELRAANEMPDLPLDVSDAARKILADEYRRVAILAYRFMPEEFTRGGDSRPGIPVMFVALEDEEGTWRDLHGHALSITAANAAEEDPCPAPSEFTRNGDDTPAN